MFRGARLNETAVNVRIAITEIQNRFQRELHRLERGERRLANQRHPQELEDNETRMRDIRKVIARLGEMKTEAKLLVGVEIQHNAFQEVGYGRNGTVISFLLAIGLGIVVGMHIFIYRDTGLFMVGNLSANFSYFPISI